MKNVTIRCCKCDKDIFGSMPEWKQDIMTIIEANNSKCSDCILDEVIKSVESEEHGNVV